MRVVCTAGHVDHGKSSLVRALTGTDPDRLKEEKERGLTTDIGYAWTDVSDAEGGAEDLGPLTVAFLDLPGHRQFLTNMLAGAGSARSVLFIVSADEGWMPQSEEHLRILNMLDIRSGIVVITKADLVDEETLQICAELVRESLVGSVLENAPLVPVSSTTGWNLNALRSELVRVFRDTHEPDGGRPRLWIDRSFKVVGSGTVVTGTLQHGSLSDGMTINAFPEGSELRVREIQMLGRSVEKAPPGARVALNLTGVGAADLRRGQALAQEGLWEPTSVFEAVITTASDLGVPSRGDWHISVGSATLPVRVTPIGSGSVVGQELFFIRLEVGVVLPLQPGDRFVLRESGRREVVGGGQVLLVRPGTRVRGARARRERIARLSRSVEVSSSSAPDERLRAYVIDEGSVLRRDAPRILGVCVEEISVALKTLGDEMCEISGHLLLQASVRHWREVAVEACGEAHADNPLADSIGRNLLIAAMVSVGAPNDVGGDIIAALVRDGILVIDGRGVRLADHAVRLDTDRAEARASLLAAVDASGFAPPHLEEVERRPGMDRSLLNHMVRRGELELIPDGFVCTPGLIDRAHELLWREYEGSGPLSASQAKTALGTTRKYALPILEFLEKNGRSKRSGDEREITDPRLFQSP